MENWCAFVCFHDICEAVVDPAINPSESKYSFLRIFFSILDKTKDSMGAMLARCHEQMQIKKHLCWMAWAQPHVCRL